MSALIWTTVEGWQHVTYSALPVPPLPTIDKEPVSVADVVRHLKWPAGSPEEVDVPRWIAAARTSIERDTGIALVDQTWDLFLDAPLTLGAGYMRLPLAPVISAEIFATNADGDEIPIPADAYRITEGRPARLVITDTIAGTRLIGGVRVRLRAGLMPEEIQPDLKQAILLQVADFAMHRGDEVEPIVNRLITGARTLIDRYVLPEP